MWSSLNLNTTFCSYSIQKPSLEKTSNILSFVYVSRLKKELIVFLCSHTHARPFSLYFFALIQVSLILLDLCASYKPRRIPKTMLFHSLGYLLSSPFFLSWFHAFLRYLPSKFFFSSLCLGFMHISMISHLSP